MHVICPIRAQDNHGAGHFGASRGSRTHRGVDFACYPGSAVLARECGTVTKLGYTYRDDLSFRYVEITDDLGDRWRYFYVEPGVQLGDMVMAGDKIGESQRLGERYPGITEHVHLEIINADGQYVDPTQYAGG